MKEEGGTSQETGRTPAYNGDEPRRGPTPRGSANNETSDGGKRRRRRGDPMISSYGRVPRTIGTVRTATTLGLLSF